MAKFGYIFAFIVGVIVFNSCTQQPEFTSHQSENFIIRQPELKKAYGAYLAGRVAHLRKNFNVAADYYMEALNEDPENKELLGRVYVILASKGRISEAAKYAEISLKKGDKNNFTYIIMAVDEMKKGRYEQVNETVGHLDGPVYKEFIIPLMSAWAYAGLNQPDKALKTLAVLDKEPSFRALYHFHAGMLNDYFDRTDEARRHYEIIVNDESMEMSFRSLQVITNFYIRNGEKDKAVQLATRYTDEKLLADMLNKLARNIRRAVPEKPPKSSTTRTSACPKRCSALPQHSVREPPALTLHIYSSACRFTQTPNTTWPNFFLPTFSKAAKCMPKPTASTTKSTKIRKLTIPLRSKSRQSGYHAGLRGR